jgi:ABC-type uncharacterized transport system ATPase component
MSRGRIIADIAGREKRELTVPGLIDHIAGSGDAVADRSLIRDPIHLTTESTV